MHASLFHEFSFEDDQLLLIFQIGRTFKRLFLGLMSLNTEAEDICNGVSKSHLAKFKLFHSSKLPHLSEVKIVQCLKTSVLIYILDKDINFQF